MQAIDDKYKAINKITEVGLEYLRLGEIKNARAAIECALSEVPSPLANVRLAHVLMFEGKEQDAQDLYLRYRTEKITPLQTAHELILDDFARLRGDERGHPLMDEVEKRFHVLKMRKLVR